MKHKRQCRCSDGLCPTGHGPQQCGKTARECMRRSDMDDRTGTLMCSKCADDAFALGLFFRDVAAFIQSR